MTRLLPSAVRRQKLLAYREASTVLATGDTLTLVASQVEGVSDIQVVAIALRHCLWYGGARNLWWGVISPEASERWNRAWHAQAGNIIIGSAEDARAVAYLYLAFATGYSLEPDSSRVSSGLLPANRRPPTNAIYIAQGLWEVTGTAALGKDYSFVMRLNSNGTVVDLWLTPQ